ncbi:MAG: M23 family metallopeptidase [Chloroflexota bacterium]
MSEIPQQDDDLPLDDMAVMHEPPIDLDDTSPTGIFKRDEHKTNPRSTDRIVVQRAGMSWLNWLMSGAALLITLAAGWLYLQQANTPDPQLPQPTQPNVIVQSTVGSTIQPTLSPTQIPVQVAGDSLVPLDVVAESLMQPGDTVAPPDRIYRQQTAYTIAPVRTRASSIQYTIQPGDTLDKIGQRFGLSTDTISWANDDIFVNRLQPGDQLTILPENGIEYKTANEETIQSIADKYKVSPFAIIDSEYNRLSNASPTTLLPTGQTVIVPGGVSTQKARYWDPGTSFKNPAKPVLSGGSGASANAQGEVSFGGGPGSCGYEPNNGGGPLRVPLGHYQVVRGFFPGHTGIDLAAPTGTTVFAAANGTVIFAGWSNWGYGNSIVLAHGSLLTLYGHLSRISVVCGQTVSGGQPIGAVGTTGSSTGPHLHFEIRPGGEPVNPTQYLSF